LNDNLNFCQCCFKKNEEKIKKSFFYWNHFSFSLKLVEKAATLFKEVLNKEILKILSFGFWFLKCKIKTVCLQNILLKAILLLILMEHANGFEIIFNILFL